MQRRFWDGRLPLLHLLLLLSTVARLLEVPNVLTEQGDDGVPLQDCRGLLPSDVDRLFVEEGGGKTGSGVSR